MKSTPGVVTKSAAAQLLPELVRSAMAVVRDQLDGLMLQFKEANPNFYNEYFGTLRYDSVNSRAARQGRVKPDWSFSEGTASRERAALTGRHHRLKPSLY